MHSGSGASCQFWHFVLRLWVTTVLTDSSNHPHAKTPRFLSCKFHLKIHVQIITIHLKRVKPINRTESKSDVRHCHLIFISSELVILHIKLCKLHEKSLNVHSDLAAWRRFWWSTSPWHHLLHLSLGSCPVWCSENRRPFLWTNTHANFHYTTQIHFIHKQQTFWRICPKRLDYHQTKHLLT